ncbi:MAG TPA: ABC transporter permease [Actinomycetota bacterium]|nr:ABC transporter permease [Actinomycetota bacterium]
MGTQRYLLGKVMQLVLTLFIVVTFMFFLFHVFMPGDPVQVFLKQAGAKYTPAQIEELKHRFGYDQPIFPNQYVQYLKDTATLNLGYSTFLYPGESVTQIYWTRMGKSLILITTSTIASMVIGVLMGIYGGWRRGGRVDNSSMTSSLVLYAMPEFVLGMILLLIFAKWLKWFPAGGYDSRPKTDYTGLSYVADVANHMILPWLTLMLAYLGEFYLLMRSSLLDVLGEDYITLARAKGVREKYVLRHHAVRNALLPTVTLIALSFGFILGGVITVEIVFSYPGVGLLSYHALQNRDFPILQATFLFAAIGVMVANLIADLTYGYLDPRVRRA